MRVVHIKRLRIHAKATTSVSQDRRCHKESKEFTVTEAPTAIHDAGGSRRDSEQEVDGGVAAANDLGRRDSRVLVSLCFVSHVTYNLNCNFVQCSSLIREWSICSFSDIFLIH